MNIFKNLFFSMALAMISVTAMAQQYRNPVIPGYHPDPSAIRVGDDYYAVNSSFQYFPGVPIFHSKDLIHWEQIGNVLDRDSQLPLKGASSWLGIYAPTIRYHEGVYYMITTNVGNGGNFLVTATDPRGPWSEPVWLEQQGIDPSLLFDEGKVYMVSNPNDMITLCEIDPKTGKQLTESKGIWQGDGGRYPEGPHIYKIGDYYYLLISEGGTELAHHITIARSRSIYGPYESNPDNPILTNCNRKGQTKQIQGTGHADLVQAADGQWWMIFLAYRNFGGSYHHLGRETYLAPVEWNQQGWPVVNNTEAIDTLMTLPKGHETLSHGEKTFDGSLKADFSKVKKLDHVAWMRIQNPIESNYALKNGVLQLTAHGTLTENQQPTYLGVRQCSPAMTVETEIDLASLRKQQGLRAGLTAYQINDGHMDLYTDGKTVKMDTRLKTLFAPCAYDHLDTTVPATAKTIRLRISSDDGNNYRFAYALDGGAFTEIASQGCSLISTEIAGGFTGVTLGMFAEGNGTANFKSFNYQER